MFITLKSTKRDIGLFNLEIADLIIGFFFSVVIAILFLIQKYRNSDTEMKNRLLSYLQRILGEKVIGNSESRN